MTDRTPIRPDSALAAEFWEKGRCDSCPVYNVHTHMGPYNAMYLPRCEAPDMVHSMDAAGVRMSFVAHHASYHAPDLGNRPSVEAVRAFPDRFRAYLTVNPHYPDITRRDLAEFDAMRDVYIGIKLHPDSNRTAIADERYRTALEFADERGLPLLSHTYGGSRFNGADDVRYLADTYPNIRFIMGHSLKSDWHTAAAIAREHENVWLDTTGVLGQWRAVDILCAEAGSGKVLFGTDLPWYGQHQGIGHLLSSDITDDDIHNICHRNAERLFGLGESLAGH